MFLFTNKSYLFFAFSHLFYFFTYFFVFEKIAIFSPETCRFKLGINFPQLFNSVKNLKLYPPCDYGSVVLISVHVSTAEPRYGCDCLHMIR